MFEWRLLVHVLLSVCVCAALAFEDDDLEVNYADTYAFYNEITERGTPDPTPSSAPCTAPDLTKWDKMFSMLENSQMRENMLLQYADDIIKVEMDSLRQEMLRFVAQYGGSCGSAVEAAGGRLTSQLDARFKEIIDRLKAGEDQHGKHSGVQQEAALQQLLSAAQSQASRLLKLESSCFSGAGSKAGFQHSAGGHQEQEVATEEGHLETAIVAMQQSKE